jgi:hypothetical protein
MGSRARTVAILAALVATVIALAGCGSSGGTSSASPAQIAPASALAYIEVTVRPQGSERSDAQAALTRLLGRNPIPTLESKIQNAGKAQGLNYKRDIQPWLGQRIGVVVMGLSNANVALVAPTNNTSAALTALDKAARGDHLSPTSYRGVNYQVGTDKSGKPVAVGIVGHNAVAGGPSAFKAIIDASHGGALASNQTFNSALSAIDSNAIVRGYVNGRSLLSAAASSRNLATLPAATRQALTAALQSGRLRGGAAFGLILKPKTISFDVHTTQATSSGRGADVSGLPEGSWLALATGPVNVTQLQAMLAGNPTAGAAMNLFRQRYGIDLAHDVLPALGPIQLAIQGNALPAVQAGLSVTPSNPAAARRVLGAIYKRVKQSKSLSVTGTPTSFVATKAGSPLPQVKVAEVGRRVLATFDEAFNQFTAPSSTLSSNPAFRRAKSSLAGGSRVPFFVDFSTLASLTSQIPSFQTGGSDYKAQQVIGRLDYFVVGGNGAKGDIRFVLGLR